MLSHLVPARWTQCKVLNAQQQKLETGHLHLEHAHWGFAACMPSGIGFYVFAWFILRIPWNERFQDSIFVKNNSQFSAILSRAPYCQDLQYHRIQKRLIHRVGQLAEANLEAVLQSRLPSLRPEDRLHPATKHPGMHFRPREKQSGWCC